MAQRKISERTCGCTLWLLTSLHLHCDFFFHNDVKLTFEMLVMLIPELLIEDWLQYLTLFQRFQMGQTKEHCQINTKMLFFCANCTPTHTPLTFTEAKHLDGTQNNALKACCPISILVSSHVNSKYTNSLLSTNRHTGFTGCLLALCWEL